MNYQRSLNLTLANSVKMLKTDFLELNQQWLDNVLGLNPEYALLWQDEDLQVYLETFNKKDTLEQRINEETRVVGFIEVDDD